MTKSAIHVSRRHALGLIGVTAILPRASLAGGVETVSGIAFGTDWRIVAAPGDGLQRLVPRIEALFAHIDALFSPWRPDSDISRFNGGLAGARLSDPELTHVTTAALDIAYQSEGAFDPTVGPLVARWGFGPIEHGGPPDWRALAVGSEGVSKTRADLTLDLCGIAKGWALDRAAVLARAEGVDNALLDLGGEFLALGRHPDDRDWQISVEAPVPGHLAPAILRLPAGRAVATSGTRAQSYGLGGRLYSHIIDPHARAPTTGGLRSVTVVAPDAMTADGWATALFAAGDDAGPALARAQHIAALFLIEEGGTMRQVRTGAIEDVLL